jgi:hypothetical protein
MFTPIPEINARTTSIDLNAIVGAGKPVVFRGLVDHWPIVQAGKISAEAFCNYLKRFDRGYDINTAYGPPSIKGRFFYNIDMSGLNFRAGQAKLSASLDYLLEHADDNPPPALAIQSVKIPHYIPGVENENRLAILGDVEPRIWIGGRGIVAAHYDPSENIACCLVGRRRFTLFPPEQVANLYVGPFESTPAGAAISMVDFDQPDYEKYPKFKHAEEAALTTELEPGDAIFIPYLWWHHVRSLESVNALMNYWWGGFDTQMVDPRNALFHAMLAIRKLPTHQRAAWHSMFEHYVFEANGEIGQHLPEKRRGILGDMMPEDIKTLCNTLAKTITKP